jgi:hypothetical protein
MRHTYLLVAAIGVLAGASFANAQAVQLPTFRYFSVDTTVSVPDRGGVILGGVDRASSGTTSRGFGPFRNRASGSSVSSSVASVHATIIDHEELDRATLAEARRLRGADASCANASRAEGWSVRRDPVASKADFLSQHVAKQDLPKSTPVAIAATDSVSDVRARAAARQQAKLDEAAAKLASGIAAEEAGKFASARGYYEAAMRLGDDSVRSDASARLAKIALPPAKNQRVATSP